MYRILAITSKDLMELMRDAKTFLFLLIMPVIFTLLFGFAFGGSGEKDSDPRLPVGLIDQDRTAASAGLTEFLSKSGVLRLVIDEGANEAGIEQQVVEQELAGAVIIPDGYGQALISGEPARLGLLSDLAGTAGATIRNEVMSAANRLEISVRAARITSGQADSAEQAEALDQVIAAWQSSPMGIRSTSSSVIENTDSSMMSFAHSSPGMMLQFAIAGLLTAAQIIVNERKSKSLQRMLTTATSPVQIMAGHYLAIFSLIFVQFLLLIGFGQAVLKINYLSSPAATLLIAVTTALCIAGLGLLIGFMSKSDEQAIIFSLIPMFVFSAMGGAWVPLELTSPGFQTIGHLSPVAWALDGFKNIGVRGLGVEAALLPSTVLLGFAGLFLALAALRLWRTQEV